MGFKCQGIARTQSPTNKNYAPELPTFGAIDGVSPTGVQWKGLVHGEPPYGSRYPLCQVSMLWQGPESQGAGSLRAKLLEAELSHSAGHLSLQCGGRQAKGNVRPAPGPPVCFSGLNSEQRVCARRLSQGKPKEGGPGAQASRTPGPGSGQAIARQCLMTDVKQRPKEMSGHTHPRPAC